MGSGSVIVQTWGTNSKSHFGVRRFAVTQYREENVGHASIELRLPDNEENTQLINRYCNVQSGTKIPFVKKTELNDEGTYESTYVVRFSFIPSNDRLFHLNPTYKDDTNYERAGHHTSERHYLETAHLEVRRAHRRVIKLFPDCSLTEHGWALDFSTPKGKYILNKRNTANFEGLLTTAQLLKDKINKLKDNHTEIELKNPKNKTILLAAKRLGLKLPKENKISAEQLLSQLTEVEKNIKGEINELVDRSIAFKDIIENKEENTKCTLQSAEIKSIQDALSKLSNFEGFAAWYSDNPNISKEIKEKIDALYPCVSDDHFDNFRGNLHDELSNLCELYSKVKSKNIYEANIFFKNEDKYLCYGRPADSQVQLPIGSGKSELNAACMLEQMRKIVDSGFEYDLYTHNCSSTALSILKAGREGKVKEVSPAKILATVTPQIVHNTAVAFRDNACNIHASQSLKNLNMFYKDSARNFQLNVKSRKCANVHEAIVYFATDNIFPDHNDARNNIFYIFSEDTEKAILKEADKPIPTELLHDLWGVLPNRTLPLSTCQSYSAVIDQNMTIGQLVQGLTVLAQIKAAERLELNGNLNSETIREENITDNKMNTQSKLLLTGLFAAAGLVIGVVIGVALVSTGVFAPFGLGVLGVVAAAATIGGGLALIGGALGFGAAKLNESPTNVRVGGTIKNPTADGGVLTSLQSLAQLGSGGADLDNAPPTNAHTLFKAKNDSQSPTSLNPTSMPLSVCKT